MSYFTEILCEHNGEFQAVDLDLCDSSTLDDLVDTMRSAGDADGEAVAVIEHEDAWFALVRLCADDEVKVFISSIESAAESPFADLLVDYLDSPDDEYEPEEDTFDDETGVAVDDDEDVDDDDDEEEISMFVPDPDDEWGGDADIYADRGVAPQELLDQVAKYQSDPARVVAHIGEIVGFADQLEAAR
ncbi:tRNA adenosine deaminase-associated protein [Brevibacterium samyangense]|uniref:tRNA adenosine deaminase-associated protein n=1 Tax=Brevibacterium samyangense TaxID=366888 RepID=A0ABN2T5M1_9MICO